MINKLKSNYKNEKELSKEYVRGFYSAVFYLNLMFMPLLFLMLFHMWGVINR